MNLETEFLNLSTKFLFINCGEGNISELNVLLNELNALDFKNQQITDARAPVRLIESFVNIPVNEDTLIVKSCYLIKILVNKQKVTIPSNASAVVISWLLKCLEKSFYLVLCDVLGTIQTLLKHCKDHVSLFLDILVSQNGILINLMNDPYYNNFNKKNFEISSPEEIYLYTVLCIEALVTVSSELNSGNEDKKVDCFEIIGSHIIKLLFKIKSNHFSEVNYFNLVIAAVNSLRILTAFITLHDGEWPEQNLGELFGVAKSFMMFGIPEVYVIQPQKIMASQQGIPEPQHIPINKGGKIPKTRKPRTTNKGKKYDKKKPENDSAFSRQPYSEGCFTLEPVNFGAHNPSHRTSDSDFSESETSRTQIDRHKLAKIRQSSLTLIGSLAQFIEKKYVFGYWHTFFPYENITQSTISLLNSVLKDPSPKCRISALQATSFMLYKSKPFLIQAENTEKPPSTFTPFSIALGNMIVTMYEILTQALSNEGDLSVLTQILKCFTVFIQATPFHRLKRGIVTGFVKYVRILTRHRDPTIKVAALMVMGFLISVPEITPEISELVGIPKSELIKKKNDSRNKNISDALELANDEEEFFDSDIENEEEMPDGESGCSKANEKKVKMPWLLQISLEYLGVSVSELKTAVPSAVMPVRMECLQVLSAMASHYSLLKDHLDFISIALINSFKDPIPEIKLNAGRVLDILGHNMNNSLSFATPMNPDELNDSVRFWLAVLPSVTEQIQDFKQNTSLRAICCDALGNIGVHIFEKLQDRQIHLVSLLTGSSYDEDSLVAAAAVRGLSVYILFPSLRDDICYVENTTDSNLRIIKDANITARVKASWSLGNITDALIINSADPKIGRINDELLKKILEVTIEAANDNDKVRCNIVRSMGNVLHLLKPEHLRNTIWCELCKKSIEKLVHNVLNTNNVKVKWNACYAIGSMMKNQFMFTDAQNIDWKKSVFTALCNVVVNSTNFKVRINSASALSVIESRAFYGSNFIQIWAALLNALEQSDNLIDYNEYKHRDNLQEQLCLSISHLINLSNKEDLSPMKHELTPLFDTIKQNWSRVMNRIMPEKSAKMFEAHLKIKEMAEKSTSSEVKSSAGTLKSCFYVETDII